jgi:hypothetical protein
MADPRRNPGEDPQLEVSQGFRRDLARLFGTTVPIPSQLDESIRAAARTHFAAKTRVRSVVRWLSTAAAAAAVLLVVFWAASLHERILCDIDTSGRVDILDAFALARALEAKNPTRREWDVNGDGVVNRGDVDAIAMSAVRIDKGGVR